MQIKQNINNILKEIPENVELITVSKNRTINEILEAYKAGQRNFGENQVKELKEKVEKLPKDIKWHMIGHLQRNKVKYIASFITLIHSVDSIKLLLEINKRATQFNKIINCLLQVHIAEEKTKYGFSIHEIENILQDQKKYKNIRIKGLMGMATFTNNKKQIEKEFSTLNKIFNKIKNQNMNILSMGMSNDYNIAIKNGSNHIRIGSTIFGKRK